MIDNSKIVLEDGIEYIVVDKIEKNEINYIYLADVKTLKELCIRKQINENDENYLVGLDNEKEFQEALTLFTEKHKEN